MNERADFRCFSSNTRHHEHAAPAWVDSWFEELGESPMKLVDREQAAFARVIPLLICGEQSAITVFENAGTAHRGAAARELRYAFNAIEIDENGHEQAWQALFARLSPPHDLQRIRRRAALFFAKLGRAQSIATHFAQISQLDSCVGAIMWHLEKSTIARMEPIKILATQIKRDEARHVAVSRRYARALGVTQIEHRELGIKTRTKLVELLRPEADALESIGIDPDRLFLHIDKQKRHAT